MFRAAHRPASLHRNRYKRAKSFHLNHDERGMKQAWPTVWIARAAYPKFLVCQQLQHASLVDFVYSLAPRFSGPSLANYRTVETGQRG